MVESGTSNTRVSVQFRILVFYYVGYLAMLSIALISYILAVPIFAQRISATVLSRITSIVFVYSAALSWTSLYYLPLSTGGVGLFSGLFHVSAITLGFQILLLIVGALLLFGWGPMKDTKGLTVNNQKVGIEQSVNVNTNFVQTNTISEHSIIVLFGVLGGCFLMTSYNLVSMLLSIELQSFAAYILCALYRNSQTATSAGLKYFLLGSLASSIIALGAALIYAGTGITNFEDLAVFISVGEISNGNTFVTTAIAGGILFIGIGYIFKVGAAPLYNWSPDVYDGVPTIITSWVSTIPKIGILVFLLNLSFTNTISEHSIIVLFGVLGGCFLMTSYNLVSMLLSIELQSFAAYILCALYRNSQTATSAGLKYFLLGSLASSIIALGAALIYAGTGITNFEDLAVFISVGEISNGNTFVTTAIAGGILFIGIGYIFKVGAAPLYNWSPDVYDGVPTIITSWVSTIPKIGILVFLLNLSFLATGYDIQWSTVVQDTIGNLYTPYAQPFQTLLLVCSVLSFVVGNIVGLSQYRIKRLLTFSTINHLGFLLLALAVSTEGSIEAFVFYLIQYSLTNVNTFLTILAFGYVTKGVLMQGKTKGTVREFVLLEDLKGQFYKNPLLVISLAISLFSMAGIPPLMGFFAKQMVLYSVSYNYSYVAVVAILTSVIGASYYLKIVKLMFFDKDHANIVNNNTDPATFKEPLITTMHSSVIAVLTLVISLYLFDSSILLNACHLLSLSLFSALDINNKV